MGKSEAKIEVFYHLLNLKVHFVQVVYGSMAI